ncbi:MAG TPA: divalent-cation tolerance protein CutA [Thermodesulfovibrionales bacterium]|nr:divalent-cation tolerance protein CutA [Thermodesulfovibrionales bacterium]
MENIVVLITASNEEEAAKIARALVDSGLAGCVNIVRGVRSIYRWKGMIEDEAEVLMIAKTAKDKFGALSKKVKEMHSYTVPEIIAFPIVEGSREYLDWLRDATN